MIREREIWEAGLHCIRDASYVPIGMTSIDRNCMSLDSPTHPSSVNADPYDLDRLAHELALRESTNDNNDQVHDLPAFVPLSHDNPYLSAEIFNVQEFLLSRSYTSLPDLRTELRDYHAKLKEELVQLINDEYEAFISLSTDLKDEGSRLEEIKEPLAFIRAQVEVGFIEKMSGVFTACSLPKGVESHVTRCARRDTRKAGKEDSSTRRKGG